MCTKYNAKRITRICSCLIPCNIQFFPFYFCVNKLFILFPCGNQVSNFILVLVKKEIEKMKKWSKNANGNNYMINSVVKDLIKFVQKSYLALTKKRLINLTFKPNYPRRSFARYNVWNSRDNWYNSMYLIINQTINHTLSRISMLLVKNTNPNI